MIVGLMILVRNEPPLYVPCQPVRTLLFLFHTPTTQLCGLLGCPFTNGLIPQAPLHSRALATIKMVPDVKGHKREVHGVTSEGGRREGTMQIASLIQHHTKLCYLGMSDGRVRQMPIALLNEHHTEPC